MGATAMRTDGGGAAPDATSDTSSDDTTSSDGMAELDSPLQRWLENHTWSREDLEIILSLVSVIMTMVLTLVNILR